MTFQDDPNLNRRSRVDDPDRSNTGMWIAGIVAVCLVLGLMVFATNRNSTTAMNDRAAPAATTPPATTGSGAAPSRIPANPAGTAPQRDTNQPAPSPSPNR
jgi:hypothetical protein